MNITTSNLLDAAGNILATTRIGTDLSQITINSSAFDTSGHLTYRTNALGGVTSFSEALNGSGFDVLTTTNPDGGTRIETHYADGSVSSVTGTGAHGVGYVYGAATDGGVYHPYTAEIKLNASGGNTTETMTNFSDAFGRVYKTYYGDGSAAETYYNILGQVIQQVDPDGVSSLTAYDDKDEPEYAVADLNQNGVIDFNGTDRITQTISDALYDANVGSYVSRTRTFVWATNSSTNSLLVSVSESSTNGLQRWQSAFGLTNTTVTVYGLAGARTVTATNADHSFSVTLYTNGLLTAVTSYDSTGAQIGGTTYAYDTQGRQNQITDARNGTTTLTFNNADQTATATTPYPGNGQSAQTTLYNYDTSQRVWNVINPDGTASTNLFYLTGETEESFGARQYPVFNIFDYAGRMTNLTTWTNFNLGTGAAYTAWFYDAKRGWLNNKVDAAGHGPSYTYTPAGRLKTRTWGRGITSTNSYDTAGGLAILSYSDGKTPWVTNTYDRLGRLIGVVDGAGNRTLLYNNLNLLLSVQVSVHTIDTKL